MTKASSTYRTVRAVCLAVVAAAPVCTKKRETVRSEAPKQTPAPQPATAASEANAPAPGPVAPVASTDTVVLAPESEWLRAEKIPTDVAGGWVTGSFIPERNKIEIRTRDVTQFSINVAMLPVDWEQLVVLGIDGRNSELRKRDFDVYHIARDAQGNWIVLEP